MEIRYFRIELGPELRPKLKGGANITQRNIDKIKFFDEKIAFHTTISNT